MSINEKRVLITGSTKPLKRIAEPEEVAEAIVYLTSPAARYVTGTVLNLGGGMTAGAWGGTG